VGRRIDEFGLHSTALGDFHQSIRIGTVLRAYDENQVDVLRDLLDGFLAILCRVADVVALGPDNLGEFLAEAADDLLRVVKAQCGLREERQAVRIVHFKFVYGSYGIDHDGSVRRFAGGSNDFLVILGADQNNRALLAGKFQSFEMNFGDQRASGIDDFERACLGFVANGRRNTMRAKNENGAMRHVFDGLDKDGAATAQLFYDISVVDDFVMDVYGSAVGLQG